MVKEFFVSYTFPFRWEVVASGFWVKYPNPFSKHVISEDVISRYITDTNVLITKRLLIKERNFHVPKWASSLVHFNNHVYVIEESHCDPNTKTLTTITKNSSMTSLMTVMEKCEYTVDPTNAQKTICTKKARIYSPLFGAGAALEQFGLKRFQKNADKATKGLEWILQRIMANKGFC